MRFRESFLYLLSLIGLLCSTSFAEPSETASFNPETLLISHFTLQRPSQWKWVNSGKHDDVLMEIIFSVQDLQHENPAMVYLNHARPEDKKATPENTAPRWKGWFAEVQNSKPFTKPTTIGTNTVSYIEITGTYRGPGKSKKLHADYTLFGADIEDSSGNVLARIIGPTKLVEANKSAFTAMIEHALRRKESSSE